MGKLNFNKLHRVVIEALNEDKSAQYKSKLKVIGRWYFLFLNSNEDELNIVIPKFNNDLSYIALTYIRFFTLTYNLLQQKPIENYEDTFLLDTVKYRPTRNEINIEDYILLFKEKNNKIISWGENTFTNYDSFLPVFKKEQLKSKEDLLTIYYTFKLLKSIRRHKLINHPLLINLEKGKSLVFNPFRTNFNSICNEHYINLSTPLEDKEAAIIEQKLELKPITNRVAIKYPYSKYPHDFLRLIGDKRLNLEFNNRFYYKEPLEHDLILIPEELNLSSPLTNLSLINYQVLNTNHNEALYNLLKQFKEDWRNLDLNRFIAPFPKYWLLFINQSESKEEWLKQFKSAYPIIENNPIINTVKDIISELYDLNWVNSNRDKLSNSKLIFPELKGLRGKRLRWAFTSFKNYLLRTSSKTTFITTPLSTTPNDKKKYIYLNAFDVIDLCNNKIQEGFYKVITPDFLYYGYQPWIKYHVFNFKFKALLEGVRSQLDFNYENHKITFETSQKNLVKSIKKDFNTYKNKYEGKEKEDTVPLELNRYKSEDLNLTSSEEIDATEDNHYTLKVTIEKNEEIILNSNERVLVQRDLFRIIPARLLEKNDRFFSLSHFKEIIEDDDFITKMSQQPESTKNYQAELYKKGKGIFNVLKDKGIEYKDKDYFIRTYLLPKEEITEETHIIPIKKNNWKIICELLSIEESDMDLAFIAYYGREKQNRLKGLYKLIIKLYTESNQIESFDNPEFLSKVKSLVAEYNDIFNVKNDSELSDIAKTIAYNVIHSIVFKEVKSTIELNI